MKSRCYSRLYRTISRQKCADFDDMDTQVERYGNHKRLKTTHTRSYVVVIPGTVLEGSAKNQYYPSLLFHYHTQWLIPSVPWSQNHRNGTIEGTMEAERNRRTDGTKGLP